MVGGAYDGAGRFDTSLALWQPSLNSADEDILPEKAMLDARVRDTLRNDAYVAGGAQLHKDNIVGGIYLLNAKPQSSVLGLDDEWEEAFQEEVEAKFTLWAESPDNWVDAARMNTFTGLVRLAVGVFTAAGEVLASVEWLRDGRPNMTAIQMVDVDRLSTPDAYRSDPFVRAGVRKNSRGAPVGYYVRNGHPSDWPTYMTMPKWDFVEARKPWGRAQMIHILGDTMRPDQTRGISEMVAALKETRITKKFRDVVLQNAVVQATYAASIESDLPTEAVFQRLGGGTQTDTEIADAISSYATAYLGVIDQYAGASKNLKIDGVKIPHLLPGTKLQLRGAGQGGPLGTEFEQSLLRYIASNLGVSYEQLSRDYTQTNYSSARAAMSETWKFMQSRKRAVADRFASTIYRLWLEEQINQGKLTTFPKKWAYRLYENGALGLNFEALARCEWIGAARGQIDELKETQASILKLNNGLSTREREMARMHGADWRTEFKQIGREERMAKKEKLRFVEEPTNTNQMNAASGTPKDKGGSSGTKAIGTAENLFLDATEEHDNAE